MSTADTDFHQNCPIGMRPRREFDFNLTSGMYLRASDRQQAIAGSGSSNPSRPGFRSLLGRNEAPSHGFFSVPLMKRNNRNFLHH